VATHLYVSDDGVTLLLQCSKVGGVRGRDDVHLLGVGAQLVSQLRGDVVDAVVSVSVVQLDEARLAHRLIAVAAVDRHLATHVLVAEHPARRLLLAALSSVASTSVPLTFRRRLGRVSDQRRPFGVLVSQLCAGGSRTALIARVSTILRGRHLLQLDQGVDVDIRRKGLQAAGRDDAAAATHGAREVASGADILFGGEIFQTLETVRVTALEKFCVVEQTAAD